MSFNIEKCSRNSNLDDYRKWFERWREFRPWNEKKQQIVERLNSLCQKYCEKIDKTRVIKLVENSPLFKKLLFSLVSNWVKMEDARKVDFESVIDRLEELQYENPLLGLTLADLLVAEISVKNAVELPAKEYLERNYKNHIVRAAKGDRFRGYVEILPNLDECDWWLDAYDDLVGQFGKIPKLDAYCGFGGLGHWLNLFVYGRLLKIYYRRVPDPDNPGKGKYIPKLPVDPGIDDPSPDLGPGDDGDYSFWRDVIGEPDDPSNNAEDNEFRHALKEFWDNRKAVDKIAIDCWAKIIKRRSKKDSFENQNRKSGGDSPSKEIGRIVFEIRDYDLYFVCKLVLYGSRKEKKRESEFFDSLRSLCSEVQTLLVGYRTRVEKLRYSLHNLKIDLEKDIFEKFGLFEESDYYEVRRYANLFIVYIEGFKAPSASEIADDMRKRFF